MELLEEARMHLHGISIDKTAIISPQKENQIDENYDQYADKFFNALYSLDGHLISNMDQLTESIVKDKLHK